MQPETDELAALLARMAAGDDAEAALERLYRLMQPRLYAFALRRLGDPFEAEDIVNDVLLEVWRSAARFQGRSQARSWILGIAHHKIVDVLRRRGRLHAQTETEIADEEADMDAALAGAQDAESLRQCLERLPDAQRTVVHLAFFEDLSYSEIARIVDIPVGTIKTRMFHAKRALKACLAALSRRE